jgi:hypothetical protein
MPYDWTLFTPAIEHASPLLAECLIYHDATAAPGMPGITNFPGLLGNEYCGCLIVDLYHHDRIHDALKKETPTLRVVQPRPRGTAKVVGMPRVGGMLHRYHWQTAA